jgi:hypothetical protein
MRMKRHFQADGSGGGGGGPAPEGTGAGGAPAADGEGKTGGEGDALDALLAENPALQAGLGERIAAALEAETAKLTAQWEQAAKAREAEAARIATLSEGERAVEAQKKQQEALDKREKDLARRELEAAAQEKLKAKGLPPGLAKVLDYADAEAMEASIEGNEKDFRAAIQAGVDERMKDEPPKAGGGAPTSELAAVRAAMGLAPLALS